MKVSVMQEPAKVIYGLATALCAVVLCVCLAIGVNLVATSVISFSFLGAGFLLYRFGQQAQDIGAATALMGQAIALTAAFQGHSWQVDTHMLFFALLVCLIVLRSIPAILMATVITAVHHLSLSVLLPTLVFPGGALPELLARTVMHAVILLLETAVLLATVVSLKRYAGEAEKKTADLEKTVEEANNARAEAESARQSAETSTQEAEAAKQRAEDLLREAKEAETLRMDAEKDRKALQANAEEMAKIGQVEQANVVDCIREAMQRLKTGDLTTRLDEGLPSSYRDIGIAFNEAIATLDTTVGEVTAQSEIMMSQVQEISSATSDLANRTERQAQMLRENSDGLAQLTEVVSKTEETVQEADSIAQAAQESARSSEAIVSQTSEAMSAIQTEAEEISQIVKVIDEIAFQTNLLALNAGVEAARAGDAGRGFAVVASEVRGLAQRSSESATNIRGLIERSGQQVHVGSTKIEETVTALSGVLTGVLEITQKTGDIAEGAQEQTTAISEINERIAHLDTATQQNAAMFKDSSAACSNLGQAASTLQDLTRRFQVSAQETTLSKVS